MDMSNYASGRRREYRTMRFLESAGYEALRSAGSHGAFDVIGFSKTDVVLVQCKLECKPDAAEVEAMKLFPAPANCRKLVHIYERGKGKPRVVEI